MTLTRILAFTFALPLVTACVDKEPDDTGPEVQDTQESEPPEDTGPEEVVPEVEQGSWQCVEGTSGPDQVAIMLEADDPQGDDTIDPMGGWVEVRGNKGSDLEVDIELICNDDGSCVGSTETTDVGLSECGAGSPPAAATAFVSDEDGNTSEGFVLTWVE